MLSQLAEWNAIHGEGIFSTRPWLVYGESAVKVKGGNFKEDFQYNAREIRFTTKGSTLYAFALGWPDDGKILIRSLAKPQDSNVNRIQRITLLGYRGKLDWKQTAEGLLVTLPEKKVSEYTAALKIIGSGLTNMPFALPAKAIVPGAQGRITLSPASAELDGHVQVEERGGQPNFGYWDHAGDSVSWTVQFPAAGKYRVQTAAASVNRDVAFVVEVGGQVAAGVAARTASWDEFVAVNLGSVTVQAPGQLQVRVRPKDPAQWQAINLRAITLVPE
jgi:alpha-L-fucosidase